MNNCYESCTGRNETLTRRYREHFARVSPCSPCMCSCTGRRNKRIANFWDSSCIQIARASSTSSSRERPSCRNRTCASCDCSTGAVSQRKSVTYQIPEEVGDHRRGRSQSRNLVRSKRLKQSKRTWMKQSSWICLDDVVVLFGSSELVRRRIEISFNE